MLVSRLVSAISGNIDWLILWNSLFKEMRTYKSEGGMAAFPAFSLLPCNAYTKLYTKLLIAFLLSFTICRL
jgi:hypothetical protein